MTPPVATAPVSPQTRPPLELADRIVAAMRRLNYQVDDDFGCLNIVYVEGMNSVDGTVNDNRANQFNDTRLLIQFIGGKATIVGKWEATTEPGLYWTEHRMNPKGAARIKFGQYQSWMVGSYHGTPALLQVAPITVYRDDNEDFKRVGDREDTGMFGIHQHGGYDYPHNDLGRSSAGCLVGRTVVGHEAFMMLVKTDKRYVEDHNYHFWTAVIPVSEIVGVVA